MKTKKSQAAMEFLMTYGWEILAAVIVIGVLAYFGVLPFSDFTTFTIYKEECWNEFYDAIIINNETWKNNKTFEKCEKVEFGEIKISRLNLEKLKDCSSPLQDTNFTIVVSVLNASSSEIDNIQIGNTTIKINRCDHEEIHYKTISKQNLTIEWLDENCECSYEGFLHKGFYCYDDGEFDGEKFVKEPYCETELERLNRGCNYYKCGDYYVEVK